MKNGWLEVDLENFSIWLNGKIVCSIEFLPSELQKDKITLYYGGILTNKGTSFSRTSSQGEWHKLDFGTYSMFLTTKKFVLKK